MKKRLHAPIRVVVVIAAVLARPTTSFAQVKVIMSGGFSAAYRDALPEFERTTGIKVTTTSGASQGDAPTTIGAQLRRGVAADVVIMSREGLDEL
jgi:molybdate transport system substrate-binding protein